MSIRDDKGQYFYMSPLLQSLMNFERTSKVSGLPFTIKSLEIFFYAPSTFFISYALPSNSTAIAILANSYSIT